MKKGQGAIVAVGLRRIAGAERSRRRRSLGEETAASGTGWSRRGGRAGRKCALSSRWRNITVIIAVPRKFGRVGPFPVGERGLERRMLARNSVLSSDSPPPARNTPSKSRHRYRPTIHKNNSIARVSHCRSQEKRESRARANCQLSCSLIHWNCVSRSDFFSTP